MPGLLPRDVPGFTGRDDELARLVGLAGGGRVVVSAIGGTAGVGKTALAVHAAHRLLPQFPDGHLYADLRGYTEGQDPAEPGEVLQVFLRRLGVPAGEVPAEVEERSGLLRQVLADRRVLMVLDNARAEAQVRPLLPGAGGSLVLVTSRSVLAGLEADERVSLDVLTEDEAVAMLARVVGAGRAGAEPQAVVEVARLCGRLPLALRIAGQLLVVHPAWPVARLVQMLASEQDRLARLGAGDLQVRAAFEISYRQLAEEDARLFRRLGLHPGPDFDISAAAALAEIESDATRAVLERLAEAHLVTEDTEGRLGLHDLLRLFARVVCQETDSGADRDAAEIRLVRHYTMAAWILDSCVNLRQRSKAEQLAKDAGVQVLSLRAAQRAFQIRRRSMLAALSLAVQRDWNKEVQQLSYNMQTWLALLQYFDDSLTVSEAALAAARRTGDVRDEGNALTRLGNAYGRLRRFEEAATCHQKSLAIFRETGDRKGEGAALNNLGNAYANLERFEEALTCYQESLAIDRETGDRQSEGETLNNLGETYRDLHRFDKAVTFYQESLAIRRVTGDRHGEGAVLSNLGMAYLGLKQFERAVDYCRQSNAIFRETGVRPLEGMSLSNLGGVYAEMGRFEDAITSYQQAVAIFQETGNRDDEGWTLTFLGNTYQEMRQPDLAVAYWREAASAVRDTGDHERAAHLEQRDANAQTQRRWRRASRLPEI